MKVISCFTWIIWAEVWLALGPLGAVDGWPGEEHDVEADHRALEQARLRHVLLHHGQDRDHGERHADQHVEADEELVKLAHPGVGPGVVDEHEDHGSDGADEHEASAGEERAQPALGVLLLVVSVPGLGPAVGEVNYQDELDEDEEEAANEAEPHPDSAEGAVWDPECGDHTGDDNEILDAPESVLDPRPGVVGGFDVDHEDAHHDEE